MAINCNYSSYEDCIRCKSFAMCPLIEPSNENLENIRKEIQFKLFRIDLLNSAVVTMKQNIKSMEQGLLSDKIMKCISIDECENMIESYKSEKQLLISEVRDLRKREKNILKVLKRSKI